MSEDFGPTFITLTDEDGNEIELEMLDALEWEGKRYIAFLPAEEEGGDETSEEFGLVILKAIEEAGEEFLVTLDDDEELEAVYEKFVELLFEEDEES